jgi:hypothetical protein
LRDRERLKEAYTRYVGFLTVRCKITQKHDGKNTVATKRRRPTFTRPWEMHAPKIELPWTLSSIPTRRGLTLFWIWRHWVKYVESPMDVWFGSRVPTGKAPSEKSYYDRHLAFRDGTPSLKFVAQPACKSSQVIHIQCWCVSRWRFGGISRIGTVSGHSGYMHCR